MKHRPDLLSTIFAPGGTQKTERLITLPLAGEVALSVIWPAALEPRRTVRLGVSVSRTMDILEQAVRATEEMMGLPFPQKHANVLIHDYPTGPLGSGGRMAFVTIDPRRSDSVSTITHEVAHAYWATDARWIHESGAVFTAFKAADNVPEYLSPSCMHFNTMYNYIRALRRDGHFEYDGCSYTLGRGMFVDLYNTLGEEAFRRGFTNLNLRTWGFVPSEGCVDIDEGVCRLKGAFVDGASSEDAAVAEEIIKRRYYGTSSSAPQ